MILRAVVIFFAVFGMSFLVTDALGFFKEDEGAVRSGLCGWHCSHSPQP